MNPILQHFGRTNNLIIGVIHFPPLPGHEGAPDLQTALANALTDLQAFEEGGVDGIIIENNYDLPHTISVGPGTIAGMTFLGMRVREATTLPLGVCVLWNDYESSFAVAKTIGAELIRIPVFVDDVETDFGQVHGDTAAVLAAREKLGATDIGFLVDIHVKHARLLSKTTIAQAAELATLKGADGVIVTGKWTGDPPSEEDLLAVRTAIPAAPIFAGSGVSPDNVRSIMHHANGVIVSTSLKEGTNDSNERNVKKWQQRISQDRVRMLVHAK